ncbi:MAG: hypothetical protein ACKO96_34505 [Flammeovirgaceae bacterium]
MATLETVSRAMKELGFIPETLDGDFWLIPSGVSENDINFSYTEGFIDQFGIESEEDFHYYIDITAPDGFVDTVNFDGRDFDVVEMERLETKQFDYTQEKKSFERFSLKTCDID